MTFRKKYDDYNDDEDDDNDDSTANTNLNKKIDFLFCSLPWFSCCCISHDFPIFRWQMLSSPSCCHLTIWRRINFSICLSIYIWLHFTYAFSFCQICFPIWYFIISWLFQYSNIFSGSMIIYFEYMIRNHIIDAYLSYWFNSWSCLLYNRHIR